MRRTYGHEAFKAGGRKKGRASTGEPCYYYHLDLPYFNKYMFLFRHWELWLN